MKRLVAVSSRQCMNGCCREDMTTGGVSEPEFIEFNELTECQANSKNSLIRLIRVQTIQQQ